MLKLNIISIYIAYISAVISFYLPETLLHAEPMCAELPSVFTVSPFANGCHGNAFSPP